MGQAIFHTLTRAVSDVTCCDALWHVYAYCARGHRRYMSWAESNHLNPLECQGWRERRSKTDRERGVGGGRDREREKGGGRGREGQRRRKAERKERGKGGTIVSLVLNQASCSSAIPITVKVMRGRLSTHNGALLHNTHVAFEGQAVYYTQYFREVSGSMR